MEPNGHNIAVDILPRSSDNIGPHVYAKPLESLEQLLRFTDTDFGDSRASPNSFGPGEFPFLADVPENPAGVLYYPLAGGAIVHRFGIQG